MSSEPTASASTPHKAASTPRKGKPSSAAKPSGGPGTPAASGTSTPGAPPATPGVGGGGGEGEEDDDDERMDMAFIQGFADKIQRAPAELEGETVTRVKITIPKRGEKDFEPLQETVNLQEMMLQNSRQALFDALQGVRGVGGKSLSHAILTPASPYPRLLISRGHVLDTLGITVRRVTPFSNGKPVAKVELLPEEAMYLAERGTLQIWNGRDPATQEEHDAGVGSWCDAEFGVKGALEMSVMEVFGRFMGTDGLTWQRYQAYAYLKRLGYTVQRTRQFIPEHFLAPAPGPVARTSAVESVRTVLAAVFGSVRALPCQLIKLVRGAVGAVASTLGGIVSLGLGLPVRWSRGMGDTALRGWTGSTYSSLFAHLRFVRAGHEQPIPPPPAPTPQTSIYDPLTANPYLPFFHVWKPVSAWSKVKWDRGSEAGIAQQKPDYILAVVESRNTPMPTLQQLDEVFRLLPDEPTGPIKRVGPQYDKKRPARNNAEAEKPAWWRAAWDKLFKPAPRSNTGNVNTLRNGDRALIVAVNDSGNTGWVRFGRCGFEGVAMV